MKFWKYSVLGNTFAVVPVTRLPRGDRLAWVWALCDATSGIATDGVALVHKSARRVRIYNADGTRAPLSGNGTRCAAAWIFTTGRSQARELVLRSDAGPILCRRNSRASISVTLPAPLFESAAIPARSGAKEIWGQRLSVPNQSKRGLKLYALSVGNPQCVIWCTQFPANWEAQAEALHTHRMFPERTNVVFARMNGKQIEVRLWERGVGVTEASGTGAAAAAVVGARLAKSPRRVRVSMPGGVMRAFWQSSGTIELEAPTQLIAKGDWSPHP